MEEKNIFKATIVNSPNGENNPIIRFKINNGSFIEKKINYGKDNWGKSQNFLVIYNNDNIKILDKHKVKKLYLLPFILFYILLLIVQLLDFIYAYNNNKNSHFFLLAILGIIPIIIGCIIYYKREKNLKGKCNKVTDGKIISIIPIFKHHFSNIKDSTRSYYNMEWRALFEFKTSNGEIFRCLENDKTFYGDRDALTHTFNIGEEIYVKYDESNPTNAYIDDKSFNFEFKSFKGKPCKAKVVGIEQTIIDSLEKDNKELEECFKQDYLICEYTIDNNTYKEKSQFPVNSGMFSIGDEILIRYNYDDFKEFNLGYIK